MLTDQQSVLNKVSLNRNTLKVSPVNENVVTRERLSGTKCISPPCNALVFTNSMFATTLWNRTAANKKNQLYFLASF